MIVKTPAIVLRRHPYTETSLVVTWLTPDAGRINTLIKGAFRPKSAFLGQVDLFYTCELLYYGRNPDGLPITREVTPVNARSYLRADWRACAVASYFCSLISRATPPQATRGAAFAWLEEALDALASDGASVSSLCARELKLLQLLGLAPRTERCLECEKAPPSSGEIAFSAKEGGWWCAACAPDPRRESLMRIPARAILLLSDWQRNARPEIELDLATRNAADRMLGAFILHHLEIPPGPRAAALDIISRQPARPVDRMHPLR